MPYSAEISVTHNTPACLLFLVDQSGSMQDQWGQGGRKKCEAVATIINRLLDTTILRCTKNDGVRDYFHIGVIGYGPANIAQFAWTGSLLGKEMVTVSQLRENAQITKVKKKIDAGDGTLIETEVEMPKWFNPIGNGSTPMHLAIDLACKNLEKWISAHADSFPPVVFNITDGEPDNAEEAEKKSEELRNLATNDGNVLLFNIHISERQGAQILFPSSDANLPDNKSALLFRMSSVIPDVFVNAGQKEGLGIHPGARGFLFNSDSVKLIEFLDIGTRTQNLR